MTKHDKLESISFMENKKTNSDTYTASHSPNIRGV